MFIEHLRISVKEAGTYIALPLFCFNRVCFFTIKIYVSAIIGSAIYPFAVKSKIDPDMLCLS